MNVIHAGPPLESAAAAIIMVHGRGASAESIMGLYDAFDLPWLAAVAPQAPGNTWYPYSFLEPLEANQPYLDRSLGMVASLISDVIAGGIPSERIALLGFSQGACLMLECAARNPRRYGALLGLTGGLIGPAGTPRNYPGSLAGTPVFIGAGDPDPHVPFSRVEETRDVLTAMGAAVEVRRYPGKPHSVSQDELDACRALLLALET